MTDVTGAVAAHPFLAGLTPEHRAALAAEGAPVSFGPGERIFAEGGVADRFWLLATGGVALDLRVPGRGDQVIETLPGGTVLGWSWLHPPYRWHFGAVAREASSAVVFDAAAVRRRCEADTGFGYAVLRCFTPVITERLQATRLRVLDLYATPTQVGAAVTGRSREAVAEPVTAPVSVPVPYRVLSRRVETDDTVTLELANDDTPVGGFAAGQFAMLTAYGVGEVPISVSGPVETGDGRARRLVHTLRAVGAVTRALHATGPGGVVGVRGPFGTSWDLPLAEGHDVVIVAGGIGLAPLRPVVSALATARSRFGRAVLLVGARTPADLLYPDELRRLPEAGIEVEVTVDRPDDAWSGHVGVVTTVFPRARFDPDRTVAFVCGPEVMMRFAAQALLRRGVPARRVRVSLERNMRCGAAWCGHCQLGPLLVCRDGPVVDYSVAEPLISVREL